METLNTDWFKPYFKLYPSDYRKEIFLEVFLNKIIEPTYVSEDFYEDYFKINFKRIDFMEERTCRILASFISFLGTNGGRALLETLENKTTLVTNKQLNYELKWYLYNSRAKGLNNNSTVIEAITGLSDISAYELEDIASIVFWLGSSDGFCYLEECRNIIKKEEENERKFAIIL